MDPTTRGTKLFTLIFWWIKTVGVRWTFFCVPLEIKLFSMSASANNFLEKKTQTNGIFFIEKDNFIIQKTVCVLSPVGESVVNIMKLKWGAYIDFIRRKSFGHIFCYFQHLWCSFVYLSQRITRPSSISLHFITSWSNKNIEIHFMKMKESYLHASWCRNFLP